MTPIAWELPPVVVACAVLMIAAMLQASLHRVPNVLTLIALAMGLLYAGIQPAGGNSLPPLVSSVASAAVAFAILLVPYSRGVLGGGCVKAQMAFATWIGAAAPLVAAVGLVAAASVVGLAVTYATLWRIAATMPDEETATYQFPAQVTLSATAIFMTLGAVLATGAM